MGNLKEYRENSDKIMDILQGLDCNHDCPLNKTCNLLLEEQNISICQLLYTFEEEDIYNG